jgi:predicted amidohydrolase YtcJ
MLRAGYLADIVIFDRDLTNIPPEEILSGQVVYTIVGGRIVFQSK